MSSAFGSPSEGGSLECRIVGGKLEGRMSISRRIEREVVRMAMSWSYCAVVEGVTGGRGVMGHGAWRVECGWRGRGRGPLMVGLKFCLFSDWQLNFGCFGPHRS